MLVIATGSNLGDRLGYLREAQKLLCQRLALKAKSRVYVSAALEDTEQPDFYNQVLQFAAPALEAHGVLAMAMDIEKRLGRKRQRPKGPRTVDIDLLFFGLRRLNDERLTLPHPRLFRRSFVVRPLGELPCFQVLKKRYDFPSQFDTEAVPL